MSQTGGQLGTGVRVFYSVTSPHSWVEVLQIREVVPPGKERPDVEASVHGTTSIAKSIPGLAEVSTLQLRLMADLEDVGHLALRGYESDQSTLWWRVETPITANLQTTQYIPQEFQGRVSKWQLVTPIDGLKEIEVEVKFNGTDLYYLGASASVG